VFVVPFGIVGVILYGFGTWSERLSKAPSARALPPDPP